MTAFMLETDISSYIIRRRPVELAEKFSKHAELRFGAEKAGRPQLTDLVAAFLERLAILDWTDGICAHYVRIRAALEREGRPIGGMDFLIASHATALRMTLVTNNLRHFSHVPGLKAVVW